MSTALPTRQQFLQSGVIQPDTCSICLETFDEKHPIVRINTPNCQHVFGKPCIENWLKDNDTCPACRTVLFTIPAPRLSKITDPELASDLVGATLHHVGEKVNERRDSKRSIDIFFIEDLIKEVHYDNEIENNIDSRSVTWRMVTTMVLFMVANINRHGDVLGCA